jgi:hypothetical protein
MEFESGARRFWASRRLASTLTSAACVALTGLFLYDVVSVRSGNPGMAWRRDFAHQLATRPLNDAWVIAGASVAAVLGLWLLILALTPGERRLLPMRRLVGGVRAGLDRRAAALALRDRAVEVSGVRSAAVSVGRRKVRVRARSHFRDREEVRADLDAALADGVTGLGLARRPRMKVRVVRAEKD